MIFRPTVFAALVSSFGFAMPSASEEAFERYLLLEEGVAFHTGVLQWACQQHSGLLADLNAAKNELSLVLVNQAIAKSAVDAERAALDAAEWGSPERSAIWDRLKAVDDRYDRWTESASALYKQINDLEPRVSSFNDSKGSHKDMLDALKAEIDKLLDETTVPDGSNGIIAELDAAHEELEQELEDALDRFHRFERDNAFLKLQTEAWNFEKDSAWCLAGREKFCFKGETEPGDPENDYIPSHIDEAHANAILEMVLGGDDRTEPGETITPGTYYDSGFGDIQMTRVGDGFLATYTGTYDRSQTGTISLFYDAETGGLRGIWSEPNVGRQGTLENMKIDNADRISGEWTVTEAGYYSGRDLDARPGKFLMSRVTR